MGRHCSVFIFGGVAPHMEELISNGSSHEGLINADMAICAWGELIAEDTRKHNFEQLIF